MNILCVCVCVCVFVLLLWKVTTYEVLLEEYQR